MPSSSCSYSVKLVQQFTKMGFPEAVVIKAIKEIGEQNETNILDEILSYVTVDMSSGDEGHQSNSPSSLELGRVFSCDISEIDSPLANEGNTDKSILKDEKISCLIDMGYKAEDVSDAIDKYGVHIEIVDLVDFLDAAQFANGELDELYPDEDTGSCSNTNEYNQYAALICMGFAADDVMNAMDRCGADTEIADLVGFISAAQIARDADAEMDKLDHSDKPGSSSNRMVKKQKIQRDDEAPLRLPKPMIGFGVPSDTFVTVQRSLPDEVKGPPYFYYENVALTPKGVWSKISRSLYKIEPEFVDSKFFSAASRKRGYIHNLPLDKRFPLLPLPAKTIFEALPGYKKWWPLWDQRKQFNCLVTCVGTAPNSKRIRTALENSSGEPSVNVKKYVMEQCRKWNLVWVGKNRVSPLEPHEMELIMGFPENHTRGWPRTERYKCLGNSFQIDTVAYHLSVLKNQFPQGINVLSLFSGIGGAEVALHKLGIRLNNVVSVESSMVCKNVLKSWWEQTEQQGRLIQEKDVRGVTTEKLQRWKDLFGGFDLVIGGSPCNNLAGGNRRTRNGLEGEHSSLFFHYARILYDVRMLAGR